MDTATHTSLQTVPYAAGRVEPEKLQPGCDSVFVVIVSRHTECAHLMCQFCVQTQAVAVTSWTKTEQYV